MTMYTAPSDRDYYEQFNPPEPDTCPLCGEDLYEHGSECGPAPCPECMYLPCRCVDDAVMDPRPARVEIVQEVDEYELPF